MNFVTNLFQDPKKSKTLSFVSVGILCLALVVVTVVLGYLFYRSYTEANDLADDKTALIEENQKLKEQVGELQGELLDEGACLEEVDELETQVEELEKENATLKEENTSLKNENDALKVRVADYQARMAQVGRYNALHRYIYEVIVAHDGFSGWTEAEYQVGYSIAVSTGDTSLINAVDNAWHNLDGDPIARFASVMWEIIEGINENLD